MSQPLLSGSDRPFDPRRRFVRLTQMRPDGFVEFDFAVGDPDVSVELILTVDAYRDFCIAQGAEHLTAIHS